MPDLSKISDEDLNAMAAGDLSKVSDEGLRNLASAGQPEGVVDSMHAKVAGLTPKFVQQHPNTDYGTPENANRMGGALMASGIGSLLPKPAGVLGRIGQGAIHGAASGVTADSDQDLGVEQRAKNAGIGALMGAGLGTAGEALKLPAKALYGASRAAAGFSPGQAKQYVANPQEISDLSRLSSVDRQDLAKGAIDNSRAALQAAGQQKSDALEGLLKEKSVQVDPSKLRGLHNDEIEQILRDARNAKMAQDPVGTQYGIPPNAPLDVDASSANRLKQNLQQQANFGKGTVLDPVQQAKNTQASDAARGLRQALEGVDSGVAPLNKQMQQDTLLNQQLRASGKTNPIAALSSESDDKRAMLERAAQSSGNTELTSLGDKLGAAKKMNPADNDDMLSRWGIRKAGRVGLRAGSSVQGLIDALNAPQVKDAIIRGTMKK